MTDRATLSEILLELRTLRSEVQGLRLAVEKSAPMQVDHFPNFVVGPLHSPLQCSGEPLGAQMRPIVTFVSKDHERRRG